MKTNPIGVRFEAVERKALEAAAAADTRPVAVMIRKIVVDYLTQEEWFSKATLSPKARRAL